MGIGERLNIGRLRKIRQKLPALPGRPDARAGESAVGDPTADPTPTGATPTTPAARRAMATEPSAEFATSATASTASSSADPAGSEQVDQLVPWGLRIGASWAWRLILVVIMVAGIGWLLRYLSEVTIPIAVAILLTALISPVANWFNRRRFPRALSAGLSMIIGLVLVSGTLTLIGTQIASQSETMGGRVVTGFKQLTQWLTSGPLNIPEKYLQVDQLTNQVQNLVTSSSSTIASYAAEFGTQLGHFFAGLAIALFATFYFLYDGGGIWRFLVGLSPRRARGRIDHAARNGWSALVHYVRATILVAFSDAIGVLIVALILRVPAAPALAALVFLGAFVPLVGAFVSGFVAVLVALVMLGWVQALIMLAGIILVMQLEGHILQPFLLGRAVKLHPLAVLLGIAIGVIVGGIVGALMSIPLLAFAKTFVQYLASHPDDDVATVVRE